MAKLSINTITSGYAAVAAINAAFTAIEAAVENTLSRDGTSPNTLSANLDMNSNKVVNLAAPSNDNDAARLVDLSDSDATGAASAQLRLDLADTTGSALVGFSNTNVYFSGTVGAALQLLTGWARDNILLLWLKQSIQDAVVGGSMEDGMFDAFLTDTIGGTSSNETYDAGGDYYTSELTTTVTNGNVDTGNYVIAGSTVVDKAFAIPAGTVVTQLGAAATAGGSVTVMIVRRNGTSYTNVAEVTFSHTGGSTLEYAALASAYTIPSDAYTYHVGVQSAVTQKDTTATSNRAYYLGDLALSATQTFTEDGVDAAPIAAYKHQGTNMTLVSAAVTAAGSYPASARAIVLYDPVDASVTLNTDLTFEVSRDGGTTYTALTMYNRGAYDASYYILSGTADISSQPENTSVKWRLKSLNKKQFRIKGVAVMWTS